MTIIGNNQFSKYFNNKIIIEKNPNLPTPVANHPDMNICIIDKTVFLPKQSKIKNIFKEKGYNTVFIDENLSNKYPHDVPLNCKAINNIVILNEKTVSKKVLDYCKKSNKNIIKVNQGYAACSVLAINENRFITSDKGIFKALTNAGKTPLLIKEGYIEIEEYNHGFIGGAGGFSDGILYFFGNITLHPDYLKIKKFLEESKVNFKYFKNPLTDIGGIMEIKS